VAPGRCRAPRTGYRHNEVRATAQVGAPHTSLRKRVLRHWLSAFAAAARDKFAACSYRLPAPSGRCLRAPGCTWPSLEPGGTPRRLMNVKSLVVVLTLLLAACSSGHGAASSSPTTSAPSRTTAESGTAPPSRGRREPPISATTGGRTTVRIASSVSPDGRTLIFAVPSCNGGPTARVEETTRAVHILVTSDTSSPKTCLDALEVRLHRLLGARILIDDKTGHQIATRVGIAR
jgi:hypothetical protein